MNNRLLGLLAAAALATAACSQNQDQEMETSEATPSGNAQLLAARQDTATYRTEADLLAERVARDLNITDPAVLTRIKNEYYARGRALQGYTAKYAADTTGRYAATKAANDRTSRRLKGAFTPAQYKAYAVSQGAYYAGPYTPVANIAARTPGLGPPVGQGVGIKKLASTAGSRRETRERVTYEKIKYDNGSKLKRRTDGSLKIRRADGTIIKIDKNGHRRVKKSLL